MITASYLLGREQKYTAGSVSSEGDSIFYSGISAVKSGSHVERGSSVGRMPDSQSREPGFESPLLPFRSLGIFFHFTTPQSTQLYK